MREQRRRTQMFSFVPFVILLDVVLALKVGLGALIILPVCAIVFFTVFTISRRPVSGTTPTTSWSAHLPVWAARSHGIVLRSRLRDTIELSGRLHLRDGQLQWTPTRGSVRLGATAIRWPRLMTDEFSVTPTWGIVPMCLLHLSTGTGGDDLWVRERPDQLRHALSAPHSAAPGTQSL